MAFGKEYCNNETMNGREPSLTAVGVYRVPLQESDLLQQLHKYYFFGNAPNDRSNDVHRFIQNCIPLSIFEIQLENLDERFRISDFTQEMPATPRRHWQTAYDEAVLTPDGLQMLSRSPGCMRGLRNGRIAFYFHYFDPSRPVKWTYGEFSPPHVILVPTRIWALLPYSAPD